jgi:hypothetical protein
MNEQTQSSDPGAETQTQAPLSPSPDAPRRGRPPNSAKNAAPTGADMITYIPADLDPNRVTVAGIQFMANIPVPVPKSKVVRQLLPIKSPMRDENGKQMYKTDDETGELIKDKFGKGIPLYHNGFLMPDGTMQTRHHEVDVPLVDVLRNNVRFSINGATPAAEKKGTMRRPETVAEYRSWAMAWMLKAQGSDKETMNARWKLEEGLREECGLTAEDEANLMPFFEAARDLAPAKAA